MKLDRKRRKKVEKYQMRRKKMTELTKEAI
jgi:hypothetical protein